MDLTDILSGVPDDTSYLVVGWFTPDYAPLAQEFTEYLIRHKIPYHLYARPSSPTGWNARAKPSVMLKAMEDYKDKTIVLMDVDCIVRGPITNMLDFKQDVSLTLSAKTITRRSGEARNIAVLASSRVVVFKPTLGARLFCARWAEEIERRELGDEHAMVWAVLMSLPDTTFNYTDQFYSGREIGTVSEFAIIVHDSAHDKQQLKTWRGTGMRLKRLFKSGRSRQGKLSNELSELRRRRWLSGLMTDRWR
jgi:hypothetical protein